MLSQIFEVVSKAESFSFNMIWELYDRVSLALLRALVFGKMPVAPTNVGSQDSLESILTVPWDAVAAVSTAVAAICAALSAWASNRSARAAQASVDEARLSRRDERSPRLVIERDFADFSVVVGRQNNAQVKVEYEARQDHTANYCATRATFSLANHGGGPGLEVSIVFELDDPNGKLEIPPGFVQLGDYMLSTSEMHPNINGPPVQVLELALKDGSGVGLPLYRRCTVDLPSCAPGQIRKVELPNGFSARLLLRGIQYGARGGFHGSIEDIILTMKVRCHTIDGELYETQCRFRLHPFWHGETNPLIVSSHIDEMPMYPRHEDARVA